MLPSGYQPEFQEGAYSADPSDPLGNQYRFFLQQKAMERDPVMAMREGPNYAPMLEALHDAGKTDPRSLVGLGYGTGGLFSHKLFQRPSLQGLDDSQQG